MDNRTNSPDACTPSNCLVQVICTIKGQTDVVSLTLPLEFFTQQILGKALNFMGDINPGLLGFSDTLDKLVAESKID